MNQSEFIEVLAHRMRDRHDLTSRDVRKTVEAALDLITETLAAGSDVAFIGFGSFKTQERAARTGVNPRNPTERIEIAARRVPKFSPGTRLKEAVITGSAVPLQGPLGH